MTQPLMRHENNRIRRKCNIYRGRAQTVAAILLASWLAACDKQRDAAPTAASNEPPPPVLLIGTDGIEWNLVLPLLAEGKLPHLHGLMERGTFGLFETMIPTRSPIIWTTIATGKTRQEHGIHDFIQPDPAAPDQPKLIDSTDRRTSALWNIASAAGRSVDVVGWWLTFPVERIHGVMVAQYNTGSKEQAQQGDMIWKGTVVPGIPGQVHPPQRQAEFESIANDVASQLPQLAHQTLGRAAADTSPVAARLWENCMWSFRADATYRRAGLTLLAEPRRRDLFLIYFGGSDVFAHRFWRYMQPDLYQTRPPDDEVAAYGRLIRDYYIYLDTVIGELLAAAPPDANVLVVSDHGMAPVNLDGPFTVDLRTRDLLSGNHDFAEPGFFLAAGPSIRHTPAPRPLAELARTDLRPVASIYDVAPTVLALMNVPVGRDMSGKVLFDVLTPEHLQRFPLRHVPTHDTPGWDAVRQPAPILPDGAAQERLDQLRALGYVKGD